jgi:diguanylate cyclase (GGDEF)-like protein
MRAIEIHQRTNANGPEATRGSMGLETVCRAALTALDASRITVWLTAPSAATISPYVSVARSQPVSALIPEMPFAGWTQTPVSDLPPFAEALRQRHVVVGEPAAAGGRMAELAVTTSMGSAHLEALHDGVPVGVLVVEPSEAAACRPALDILAASAVSWVGRRHTFAGRSELEFLAELAETAGILPPPEVLRLVCRRLAQVLGVTSGSMFSEDDSGAALLLMSETADGSGHGPRSAHLGPLPLVQRVLSSGHPEFALVPPSELTGTRWQGVGGVASALAVPIGDRAVLVLDNDRPFRFGPDHVRLVVAVAAQVGEAARFVSSQHKRVDDHATAGVLRRLLETGLRACSPMEAAEALAGAAAEALGFPTACAYLVDDGGYITEVATVGAGPGLGEALRATLVGKLAAESPVWRRTMEGPAAGPDLITDTSVPGTVRPGGVADLLALRSLAAIPLLSSDGPLGLVLCGDPQPRERWRHGDRDVLAQLALEGAVVVDNARLRATERHEASHDTLTGLLNRRAFSEQFSRALAVSTRSGKPLAVLVLDLNRFKQVNDQLGHHWGDELLAEVGRRLRASLGPDDISARMGGDEFVAVLVRDGDRLAAEAVATRIKAAIREPIALGDHFRRVECSIGLALFPEEAVDADKLLQRADLAMYAAKRFGRTHDVYPDAGEAPSARPAPLPTREP